MVKKPLASVIPDTKRNEREKVIQYQFLEKNSKGKIVLGIEKKCSNCINETIQPKYFLFFFFKGTLPNFLFLFTYHFLHICKKGLLCNHANEQNI